MRFLLLGSVTAWAGDRQLDLGPPKQRTVLAVLAMECGHAVPVEVLVDRLWEDAPPREARGTLYAYVARLKRIVDGAAGGERLVRRSAGYLLDVPPDDVDVHRFRRLAAEARAAEARDDAVQAGALLDQARNLWRGPALVDLPGGWASRVRHSLDQQRLGLLARWAQAQLATGDHDLVVDELSAVAAEQPLEEPIAAALVLALCRAGRTAQALETYAAVRRRLNEEVGTEPGPELRAAHAAVLRVERPAGERRGARPSAAESHQNATGPRPPAQLPADVASFTGRASELAMLDRLLLPAAAAGDTAGDAGGDGLTTVVISAIAGTAGVGKTALAVRWAHRVRSRFPDGQLYVNLRGYDPRAPVAAADALVGLLTAMGVPEPSVPLDPEDRAALYRTQLADRRILVVLDNASSDEQVRPLLPGSPTCTVLVTSRDSLPGLVARDGARRLDLDLLPLTDAVALLGRLVGPRVDADPAAAAALAERCARLPLALRVAAELAVSRPGTPLTDLVAELDDHWRLDMLDAGGDPRAAVRAVFSWSIRHLPPGATRAFALLGLHPGPDLDGYAAAALTGDEVEEARRSLELLARAHLVHPTGRSRYGMHDLLRAYAADLAADLPDEGGEPTAVAALGRLFDYYLATATTAADVLNPAEAHRHPTIEPAPTPAPALADPEAARAWLDAERAVLVAVAGHGARNGWQAHTIALSTVLFRYLDGGHFNDALAVHGHANDAARETGDTRGEAQALANLGTVHMQVGSLGAGAGVGLLERALDLFRIVGDRVGQARALGNLGVFAAQLGRYEAAVSRHEEAITLYRDAGDLTGEARTLGNLGILDTRLGRYERSAENQERALKLFRETGDRIGEAVSLNNLGEVETKLGRYQDAAVHQEQALALCRQIGDRSGEAWAINSLGIVALRQGRIDRALDLTGHALTLFRASGERDGQSWALNGLAEATFAAGDPAAAITHHSAALDVATEGGERGQMARAHHGTAQGHFALGRVAQAEHHWREALRLYRSLSSPETEVVLAAAVAALGDDPTKFRSGQP